MKGITRDEIFLKKVKEFRNPVDEKQTTTVNKVRNFESSFDFMIAYLIIFVFSLFIFVGIQTGKYFNLKSNAIEIRLSYSQITNIGFYNIYQNLGIIKIMEVIKNESKGIPVSSDDQKSYNSLLDNLKEKSYRFQFDSGIPTFKDVLFRIESSSACELLKNSSFSCSSKFEEIFYMNSFRSSYMGSILLMKKFNRMLKAKDRAKFVDKKDLMTETNTVTQSLVRLVSVFNKVNEDLNNNLELLVDKQLASAENLIIIESIASVFMLIFGGLLIYHFLNSLSMENSSFIKVLPFNLIVKNQYFKIYLNKNKY